MLSRLVNHHMLGLDVNDFGVRVEGITDADDVRLISGSGNLDNGLGRCFFRLWGLLCRAADGRVAERDASSRVDGTDCCL